MPRTSKSVTNFALLEAALEGLKIQKERIEEQISEVERLLRGRGAAKQARGDQARPAATPGGKRRLSPAARKRIAAAQKKRWAEYRKQTEASVSGGPTKRARKRGPAKKPAPAKQP
jgi:hypothetical protein